MAYYSEEIHNLLNELDGVEAAQDINQMNTRAIWEFAAKPFERVLGKGLAAADQGEIAAARPEVQRQLASGRKSARAHLIPQENVRSLKRSPLEIGLLEFKNDLCWKNARMFA